MPSDTKDDIDKSPAKEPFTTIDDLFRQADDLEHQAAELKHGLKKLSEYKYPLALRKIRKEVIPVLNNNDERESKQIKAGSRTYFLDVEKTNEGKPYLRISESRFKGEDGKRERQSILVFPEQAQEFAQAVTDMVSKLA